jgi:hypothetical protein
VPALCHLSRRQILLDRGWDRSWSRRRGDCYRLSRGQPALLHPHHRLTRFYLLWRSQFFASSLFMEFSKEDDLFEVVDFYEIVEGNVPGGGFRYLWKSLRKTDMVRSIGVP